MIKSEVPPEACAAAIIEESPEDGLSFNIRLSYAMRPGTPLSALTKLNLP